MNAAVHNPAKPIGLAVGSKKYNCFDVSTALRFVAKHYGCEVAELTCEAAEPFTRPVAGRAVWVYRGEFDADTACQLYVPLATYKVWRAWRGAAALA